MAVLVSQFYIVGFDSGEAAESFEHQTRGGTRTFKGIVQAVRFNLGLVLEFVIPGNGDRIYLVELRAGEDLLLQSPDYLGALLVGDASDQAGGNNSYAITLAQHE